MSSHLHINHHPFFPLSFSLLNVPADYRHLLPKEEDCGWWMVQDTQLLHPLSSPPGLQQQRHHPGVLWPSLSQGGHPLHVPHGAQHGCLRRLQWRHHHLEPGCEPDGEQVERGGNWAQDSQSKVSGGGPACVVDVRHKELTMFWSFYIQMWL